MRRDCLVALGHDITGHGEYFPEMHLSRIRLGRKALALLSEHLSLEPLQLMLQGVNLLTLCRDGVRLRQDELAHVHGWLTRHFGVLGSAGQRGVLHARILSHRSAQRCINTGFIAAIYLPITLALSLHASNDALRATLIPTARKWKLDEILDACAEYTGRTRRDLTFEYLLIGGINDSPEQARELVSLLGSKCLPGNVNLIPFNYVETEQGFRRPTRDSVARFRAELVKAGRTVTQRMTRGHSIAAACGQLRRTMEGRTATIIPIASIGGV